MAAQVIPQSSCIVSEPSRRHYTDSPAAKQSPQPTSSYTFPSGQPVPNTDTSAFRNAPTALPTTSHRRAHTAIRMDAVHDFSSPPASSSSSSSGPSMSIEPSHLIDSQPLTFPSNQPNTSPTRSRHRRVMTEFGGGHFATFGNDQSTAVSAMDSSLNTLQPRSPQISQFKGHRHRRSGAMSQTDINFTSSSSVQPIPGEFNKDFVFGREEPAEAAELGKVEDASLGGQFESRSVDFSELEVIARPLSLVSSLSGSSQSTVRDSGFARDPAIETARDSALSTIDSASPPSSYMSSLDSVSTPDTSATEVSDFAVTAANLSDNFDQETPPTTWADANAFWDGQGAFVPRTEARDGSNDEEAVFNFTTNPSRHSLPKRAVPSRVEDAYSAVIDLDFADVNERPTSASGLERKRANMASYQKIGGFLAVGGQRHRRAESAPLLAPPSFSASFRSGGVTAGETFDSEHVLEKVFEEDEEETEDSQLPHSHPSVEEYSVGVEADKVTTDSRRMNSVQSWDGSSVSRAMVSPPILLPGIQFDEESRGPHMATANTSHYEDTDLYSPQPKFAALDRRQGSATSSPKFSHSILSSAEPSPRFRQSVDDVPSLISGSSTMGSFMHPSFPATASVASLDQGNSVGGSTHSLASSSKKFHRKRGSIISLSRWVGLHSVAGEERQAHESKIRSQSSSDLPPRPKGSKTRRLSRMLKFWSKGGAKEGVADGI